MASNCNTPPTSNLCTSCGSSSSSSQNGCLDIYNTSCIQYDGGNLLCAGVAAGSFLNDALCSINNELCTLQDNSGLVKTDSSDNHPDTLIEKLVAGANIILTGIGSGDSKQIRIDAILGGQVQDQYVKISSLDQTSGYLSDKLVTGPCISLQKINPGLNEKLQVVIDWNCVLNQISQLPGFCTVVNSCIPSAPTINCPYIVLNNPNIVGSTLTTTWLSSGISFNVYIDGVLQPNMPTSALTYSLSNISNGSHTIEVVALCNSGTPQRDSQTFMVNTVCPVPSQLSVALSSGNANLTWSLDSNSNNGPQTVQYKLSTVSNWTTATTTNIGVTNAGITGLNQNRLYNFQVINNCTSGGPSPSTPFSAIELTCPTVNLTSTSNSVTYSFVSLGGDINTYTVTLFDSTGNNVIQTKTENAPFASTVTNKFSGLSPNTSYQAKVVVNAGTFSKACNPQTITTPNVPSCPTLSNFTVIAS